MAKKTYKVLNNVLHGVGAKHTQLRPGDEVEMDPDDPEQADTIATLIAKDYIEDPKNPRKRTPDEIANVARRAAIAEELPAPAESQVRSEQSSVARFRRVEAGEEKPSDAEEKIYGERLRKRETTEAKS